MAPHLATITVDNWDDAKAHLDAHTSDNADTLPALAAALEEDLHHLVLDPDTRTLWWAYDNQAMDGDDWTIEQYTAEAGAEALGEIVGVIQDCLADPEAYNSQDTFENHQAALDEYTEILRLALPTDPAAARATIKRRRALIARQDQLLQRADANLVRDLVGTEHGGAARAARALHITQTQASRLIAEDDRRRTALSTAVKASLLDR